MRIQAFKYLGGNCMFLFKACLKAATDGASLTSFGRLFHRILSRERNGQRTDLC